MKVRRLLLTWLWWSLYYRKGSEISCFKGCFHDWLMLLCWLSRNRWTLTTLNLSEARTCFFFFTVWQSSNSPLGYLCLARLPCVNSVSARKSGPITASIWCSKGIRTCTSKNRHSHAHACPTFDGPCDTRCMSARCELQDNTPCTVCTPQCIM